MVADSPVAEAFVPAPDHWSRAGGGIRAIVVHMAEGGGTVPWLTRLDGNSSHYVVEYTGRVVQMVRESEAAGSMNPKTTRAGNDAPFTFEGETITYGRTALNAAGLAGDPNRYAVAIEVEGFAAAGPSSDQATALGHLVADIRRRLGAGLHLLGHRDQQDYKACPGHRMPWARIGGRHGAPLEEGTDVANAKPITTTTPTLISFPDGTPYFEADGVTRIGTHVGEVDRYSPYGAGTQRAIYVEVQPNRRIALVTPSSSRPIPAQTAGDAAAEYNAGLTDAATAVAGVPRR